jgi:hypothetical protein
MIDTGATEEGKEGDEKSVAVFETGPGKGRDEREGQRKKAGPRGHRNEKKEDCCFSASFRAGEDVAQQYEMGWLGGRSEHSGSARVGVNGLDYRESRVGSHCLGAKGARDGREDATVAAREGRPGRDGPSLAEHGCSDGPVGGCKVFGYRKASELEGFQALCRALEARPHRGTDGGRVYASRLPLTPETVAALMRADLGV